MFLILFDEMADVVLGRNMLIFIVAAALLGIVILGAIGVAAVLVMQKNTAITFEQLSPASCKEGVLISGFLKDQDSKPVVGDIQLAIKGSPRLVRSLSDGSFSLYYLAGTCPENTSVEASFAGDWINKKSGAGMALLFPSPTSIDGAGNPLNAESGALLNLRYTLRDANLRGITGARLSLTDGSENLSATTDASGIAGFAFQTQAVGLQDIRVRFDGSSGYSPSQLQAALNLFVPKCPDGTEVGHCSTSSRGDKCVPGKTLQFDCKMCGCPDNKVCEDNNECITNAEATTRRIAGLKKQVVEIKGKYFSGSGVAYGLGNDVIIITNRHVAEGLYPLGEAQVTNYAGDSVGVKYIKAPSGTVDIAAIWLSGPLDIVPVNMERTFGGSLDGRQVIAIGSPRGLKDSISEGVVSATRSLDSCFGIAPTCIQTDAAINPGNSGGGLFDKETGTLLGITSAGIRPQDTQNINLAIDVTSIQLSLALADSWTALTPSVLCSDGTMNGECSASMKSYTCSGGTLVQQCSMCGCPAEFPYCGDDGACFRCQNGGTPYQTKGGSVYCCSAGSAPYLTSTDKGFCCQSSYGAYETSAGAGFCCPPGTFGKEDGKCYSSY